MGQNDGKG